MIYFKFVIDNPWFRHQEDFKNRDYLYKEGSFTKHKHWELQISRWEPKRLIEFDLDLRWRGEDHAGPSIEIELFGFMCMTKIYDSRHWNYSKSRWYLPGEEAAEDAERSEDEE